jgi:pentatricopeptide repeat protein
MIKQFEEIFCHLQCIIVSYMASFGSVIFIHETTFVHFEKFYLSYSSVWFCRYIYTTALNVLGKANRPFEALNVFYSMRVLLLIYDPR